ncbi:MAG: c-type cytochrome [Anaerolineales bacterium]|nr:c-type cytochrome [Anaerolineales bacterium]
MVINLIIFLVLLALTVGAGWLTWRAVRAQRRWVQIAGGLGAGALTLVLAAMTYAGGAGLMATYFPGAPAAPDLKVAGTPEQIARGEYLVNLSCIGCHGAVDANGNPSGQMPLTGGWDIAAAEGFGFIGSMVTENLTPGGKLAGYSDGELFRVLRHSINQQGQKLGFMDFLPYKELSDADMHAIIAYLRSLPAAQTNVPTGDNINFIGALLTGAGMFPHSVFGAETVMAPPEGVTAEYGKYVATFGECRGCHGPDMTGVAESSLGPAVPNPRPLVGTLTQAQADAMQSHTPGSMMGGQGMGGGGMMGGGGVMHGGMMGGGGMMGNGGVMHQQCPFATPQP